MFRKVSGDSSQLQELTFPHGELQQAKVVSQQSTGAENQLPNSN